MNSQYFTSLHKRYPLPDSSGIYIFRDQKRRPLYIGRATSLKDRVKSYFRPDIIATRGPRIVDMVTRSRTITWEETASVLEAIIRESVLIKRYQPKYNVDERDDKSDQYVIVTDEAWPRVFLARARDLEKNIQKNVEKAMQKSPHGKIVYDARGREVYRILHQFGPYPAGGLIKDALKIIRRLFPFRDKKSTDPRHEAFCRSIGRSPRGTDSDAKRRYRRTIKYLVLFFEGGQKKLQPKLEKDMKKLATAMAFEEAGEIKRLIYALNHINDIALIKADSSVSPNSGSRPTYRIEAYDIAHMSGQNVVGAFVVIENGVLNSAEYRTFKMTHERNNDVANIVETLSRRLNHPEWPYPDLIVVDGGEAQKHAAEAVLSARRISIPVIAVVKDDRHRAAGLLGTRELISLHQKSIIAANAEAHRFVIRYHRKRRDKFVILST